MSSATLSSSPGPSTLLPNTKRALSANREDRVTKRSRTTSEEPSAKRDLKDRKKRRKKKRKVSVVVIEDGRARIKDPRRGLSQSLVPLSPVKAGESSRSSLVNDEREVEEVVSSPRKDKGKGKAVESPQPDEPNAISAEAEVARLTKELAFKNELIEKHQNAVTQAQQAITCQVCLELMYKPYALSPCGHLACYECLVSWFKASPEDRPAPPPVLMRKKTCPHCRAAITDRPVQVWGVKSIVSSFSKSGLLQGSFLPPDEPGQSSSANENADPWDGIFRKAGQFARGYGVEQLMAGGGVGGAGFLDHEDGGVYRCYDCMHEIWDGLCSNCGRAYPAFDESDEDYDFENDLLSDDEDDFGDDGDDDVAMRWMAEAHADFHALGPAEQPHAVAQEMQARMFEIEAERAADEGRELDFGAVHQFFSSDGDDDEDEEEEYEGSFIDDENDVGIPRLGEPLVGAEIIELSSGSEDEEFPARRRRSLPVLRRGGASSSSRLSPIEVSDDDDDEIQEVRRPIRARGRTTGAGPIVVLSSDSEEDENSSGSSKSGTARHRQPSRTRTRNPTRVESTDEDNNESDDGIDPNMALRIAAEERDLYGEDDSIPRIHQDDIYPDEVDLSSDDLSSAPLDNDGGDEDGYMPWAAQDDIRGSPDSYVDW